ncbi:MAG TPA: hypothetical protein VH477_10810 [Bryobacteraceae bacterium]|jgi:hypothetical protein
MKMFKTFGLMAVIASGSLVEASEYSHSMRVNVPFAFAVDGQHFAPGEYDVRETASGVITLQGEGKAVAVISIPLASPKAGDVSSLRFRNNAARDLEAVALEGEGRRGIPVRASGERKLTFAAK